MNFTVLPMKAWQFILDAMRRHPTLFPTPLHALHHMMVVCGSGFEWKGGRIRRKAGIGKAPVRIPMGHAADMWRHREFFHFHGFVQWCPLWNIPDDARPDWLMVAEELAEYMLRFDRKSYRDFVHAKLLFTYRYKDCPGYREWLPRHVREFDGIRKELPRAIARIRALERSSHGMVDAVAERSRWEMKLAAARK